ncbi:hypothetical protein B4N89_45165 [Embleya scabrispora]|uniref:Uncharacterized protein n=1 Tax=Embleya scabrispora TaxID=159449 RepID=A0A1T3NIR3_9ACTN|nr:hypothetical protein [Embleya scabrispora]OPC76682.1 hypothetical protein B4N89_45165 [Embleya scabrispora]
MDAESLATKFERSPDLVRTEAGCYFVAGDMGETVYVPISDDACKAILSERRGRLRAAHQRADAVHRILATAGITMAAYPTSGIAVTVGSCQANVYWWYADSTQRDDPLFRRKHVAAELERCVAALRDHGWTLGPGDRSGMHPVRRL